MKALETVSLLVRETMQKIGHADTVPITRGFIATWMNQFFSLSPSVWDQARSIALAIQLGGDGYTVHNMAHPKRLDFILDRLTEELSPEEWAENLQKEKDYARGQSEVFAAAYGGR